ncbi:DUF6850 family outer membrane beta-barrel protein [Algoriphagus resistens]|uniref:DUF6850 family outer membrane beta-barrel protein n=1 Tax=Algoriphagus resistens TaxID=1750590 RepID=UPI000AC4C255|nr:DUF6850 family outer membrane beta-barrel protein [Algoriphagus resistens]
MRFIALITLLCLLNLTGLMAQSNFDSSLVSIQAKNELFHFSHTPVSGYFQRYDFGFSGANYTSGKYGEVKSPQLPQKQQEYQFFSQGKRTWNDWILSGAFSYTKQLQDSIGWKQVREITSNPYYFGNIKPGNWNNDLFDAQLAITRPVWSKRILVSAGADYQLENLVRTNDPRPTIDYYNLELKGQISFQVLPEIFVYGLITRANSSEKGGVKNYNASNDSYGQVEYNLFTLMGFGSYNLQQKRNYNLNGQANGFGGGVIGKKGAFRFSNEFQLTNSTENFIRKNSDGDEQIGEYYLRAIRNDLFIHYSSTDYMVQLISGIKLDQGDDYNFLFRGLNYDYHHSAISTDLVFSKESLGTWEWGVGVDYSSLSKQDYNASHYISYATIKASVYSQVAWRLKSGWQLSPQLELGFQKAMDEEVSIGANQENDFTRMVLYPDYYTQLISSAEIDARVDFSKKFSKFRINPFLGINQTLAVGELPTFWESGSKDLFSSFQLGVNFVH